MPNMANIIVKDASNADVTFVGLVPASGDRAAALWRAQGINPKPLYQPKITVVAQPGSEQRTRKIKVTVQYPIVETVNGTEVVNNVLIDATAWLPMGVADADASNGMTVCANVLSSTKIKEILTSGYNAS